MNQGPSAGDPFPRDALITLVGVQHAGLKTAIDL
jgi:hypothetical protein